MILNIPGLVEHICKEIQQRTDVAVVGMSGGADSTLIALLCKEALGAEKVFSVHMPYGQADHEFFNARSVKTATKLGVQILRAPINAVADAINLAVTRAVMDWPDAVQGTVDEILEDVNAGNARSRARMTVLYGIAHHLGTSTQRARVIGTGNLSEDFIGYDTKGGDALCDFFPIGQLFKSEVYQLLEWFRDRGDITDDMIDRRPSAGLWDGQSDEDELGYTYDQMEPSIRKYFVTQDDPTVLEGLVRKALATIPNINEIDRFVLTRHLNNKHKHEAPPSFALRKFCDAKQPGEQLRGLDLNEVS